MRRLGLLPLIAIASLSGCGGSSGDAGADPAAHVPADAALYAEVVVRPEGDQAAEMKALLSKVLQTQDPAARVIELVDRALGSGGESTSYREDFEPWLGRRVGAYLGGLTGDEPTFVIAFAAKDTGKAAEKLEEESERDGAQKATYEDTEYWVSKDGDAATVAGDALLVADSEKQIRRAIDAVEGDSLADAQAFRDTIKPLPADREGMFYLDAKRLIDAALASGAAGAQAGLLGGLVGAGLPPTAGALLTDEDTIAIETLGSTAIGGPLGALAQGAKTSTPLLGELPGDSWAALAVPDLGKTARTLVQTVGGAVGGALLQGQLEQSYGVDLDADVFSWMGDAAVFVRGEDLASISGAVVIAVTDAERARAGVTKLVGLARQQGGPPFSPARVPGAKVAFRAEEPGLGRPIIVAVGEDRAVIALGEDAAEDGLQTPSERLGESEIFSKAKEELDGLEPALILDGQTAGDLIRAAAGGEEGFAEVEPYLRAIEVIAAGSGRKGDDVRQRFAIGVR